MAQKTISVVVEEKSYEVGQAVKNLVKSAKDALADGFQPGQDLPKIVSENFSGLITAVGDMKDVPAEAQEDVEAFMKAWGIAGLEIAGMFLKKPQAPAAPAAPAAP